MSSCGRVRNRTSSRYQEVDAQYLDDFIAELNQQTAKTWDGRHRKHCNVGTASGCTSQGSGEGVMLLSTLPITGEEGRTLYFPDDYWDGRGAQRLELQLPDQKKFNVWSVHATWGSANYVERRKMICELKQWAGTISGPKLLGGDFNAVPTTVEMGSGSTACTNYPGYPIGMRNHYTDGWIAGGGSASGGHTTADGKRIDYWFDDIGGDATPLSTPMPFVDSAATASDHYPLTVSYSIAAFAGGPTTLFSDDFNNGVLGGWSETVFSGGTRDATIEVEETVQTLQIGPLKQNLANSHYNGITTNALYNITNGYVYVQLVQPGTGVETYAMFTVGTDSTHFYRLYVAGGRLYVQKHVNGKVAIFDMPYNSQNPLYLKIGNVGSDVVFETAPGTGATPGQWTEIAAARQTWDSAIPKTVKIELKGGTSAAEANPGTVVFDNVKVVKN